MELIYIWCGYGNSICDLVFAWRNNKNLIKEQAEKLDELVSEKLDK